MSEGVARMKKHRSLMKMGLLFVVIWLAIEWSWAGNYVDQLKYGEQYVAMTWHASVDSPDEQTLRQQIELQAVDQAVAPIDAKIDRIWKAIPGLNGKEVDIEATLRLAQKLNGSIHWVYQEVSPRVTLEDLGASPIYKGNPHKKMVSLMFNVAWGEE